MTNITIASAGDFGDDLRRDIERIQQIHDLDMLLNELRECLTYTLKGVITLAALVGQIEAVNGEIPFDWAGLPFIRLIAHGQMVADLYVTLQGDQVLLEKSSTLPIPEQKKIALNEPIKVMLPDGDHLMVPPLALSRAQTSQVFARRKIRSEAEQVMWLRERKPREDAVSPDECVHIDRKRGELVILRPPKLSKADLVRYLGELTR